MVSMKKYGMLIDLYQFLPGKNEVFTTDLQRTKKDNMNLRLTVDQLKQEALDRKANKTYASENQDEKSSVRSVRAKSLASFKSI
jgi:hypothetical protein